ncbi:hypothetical protein B0T24DRAFT_673939 [Lasiosphaeria ovina]|uniref:Uncharacterized protein n=1 Tax=Lasiosphaeria ovina TaxID=92902 RepID=A0AAE0TYJ0_9PEZI|nr:hypothetical protein B0T24DRAFT_673939 [Lasiosphaeria ovina]
MEKVWLPHMRSPDDSWAGVTDSNMRKLLQNRLASRRYLKTQVLEQQDDTIQMPGSSPSNSSSDGISDSFLGTLVGQLDWTLLDTGLDGSPNSSAGSTLQGHLTIYALDCPWRALKPTAFDVPEPAHISPSSLTLTMKFSHVSAALWRNADAIGLDCGPPAVLLPGALKLGDRASPPASLQPTVLQAAVAHNPLIDCIPFPSMRDRILGASLIIDMDTLRDDVLNMGFMCWGRRPWDARGWEIPEAFVDKYWWLLDEDMLAMTNFWREERAEEPLVWRGRTMGAKQPILA